ncbi:hypothetical protein SAMN04488003_10256 [Loktanella fryxellensis]|uniref:Uncharacterized protein n=1 Tax=Loktanella fryxellensis TaxID=245187 RepID=A0A1H7ZQP9_9RHOB|nr:DUF6165 family protein [Loktanella fryxellensis]SEM59878.1 hypothetical protein SAMN04488003_10256 [Loktanella fryxellensis]
MNEIMVPTSPGELIDKLTILRLKAEQMTDRDKLANVQHEQAVLTRIAQAALPDSDDLQALWDALYEINADLWAVEDDIRACEARGDFGAGFVALARAVYVTNDERAAIKKRINQLLGSAIVEEKSYHPRSRDA